METSETLIPEPAFSDVAARVLSKRILRRNAAGEPVETPEEMFGRVAWEVAKVERSHCSEAEVHRLAKDFFRAMYSLEFLPNSPTLVNAGLPDGQLAGCFVLPLEDSMGSIFGTLRSMALIQKSGGGTGFSFSSLRPKDDLVATTKGSSSGPVSFMRLFDYACEVTRLGGVRSGANMGVMRCDHPDILEFINTKVGGDVLKTFNISVAVTDHFMECVRDDAEYALVNPRTKEVAARINARHVFDLIVGSAWKSGDPGLLFIDRINAANPTPSRGSIEATNPCGEQPLLPYESCVLGSINLSRFVAPTGGVDYERLRKTARIALRFLDDIVDANKYPIPEIETTTKANRKVGVGVMGFADLLIRMGIAYDSESALAVGEEIMMTVSTEAERESERLADIKGYFPNYAVSVFAQRQRRRNASVSTVAPTGTISLLANCSSGIEPLYALTYTRIMLGAETRVSLHPLLEELAAPHLSSHVRRRIVETGSIRDITEMPEHLRRLFVTAYEVAPEWHVRMQAAFQRHVDSAVSKTVNLSNGASKDDVSRTYLLADQLQCKGITVYRDGCRDQQVLKITSDVAPPSDICPECSGTMVHASGCVTCGACGYTYCNV